MKEKFIIHADFHLVVEAESEREAEALAYAEITQQEEALKNLFNNPLTYSDNSLEIFNKDGVELPVEDLVDTSEVEFVEVVRQREVRWDDFFALKPLAHPKGGLIDCDPRLAEAPYTEEELAKLNGERRVWSSVAGDSGHPHILPGLHFVDVISIHVTEDPYIEALV